MRRSIILTAAVALFLAATPARAEKEAPADAGAPAGPFPVATALDTELAASPDSWQTRWDAYQKRKADLAAERKTLTANEDAWRKREKQGADSLSDAEQRLAGVWDAFIPVQTRIATALRRDQLSLGALLMGFFAATLLWGGFTVTVTIAMRSEKQKRGAAAS